MKLALGALAAVVSLAAVAGLAGHAVSASEPGVATSDKVDDFQLTDTRLMAYQLYYYKYAPAVVLMTRTETGPYSAASAAELEALKAKYADRGVLFFMIDSTLGQSRDAAAAEAAREHLTIPVLMDEYQLVGEGLGVKREGEVFVLDPKTWRAAYRGPVSGSGHAYTADAIDAVLAGKAPDVTSVALTAGKPVAFPEAARKAEFAKISYGHDIAPILQEKCAGCHLKGGIGPFPMDSYQVIRGFSPMIREVVRTRRMPPYFADPHIGAFKNDQGLTAQQSKLLVHWVEAGSPRGDGPDPLLVNKGRRSLASPT